MSKIQGFDFDSFRKPVIEVEYLPHASVKTGEGVQLKLNLDLLTLEKMDQIEARFATLFDDPVAVKADALAKTDEIGTAVAAKAPTLYTFEKAMFQLHCALLVGEPGDNNPDSRFIREWNVVRDGEALPVSYESLVGMSSVALKSLYDFVTGEANKPSKEDKKKSPTT